MKYDEKSSHSLVQTLLKQGSTGTFIQVDFSLQCKRIDSDTVTGFREQLECTKTGPRAVLTQTAKSQLVVSQKPLYKAMTAQCLELRSVTVGIAGTWMVT